MAALQRYRVRRRDQSCYRGTACAGSHRRARRRGRGGARGVRRISAWRRTPPEDRIQYLFKLKQLLEDHVEELAQICTQENGKTVGESRAELRRAIENVEVACGIPTLMQGYNLEDVASGIDEMMIRQPLGVT